MDIYIYSGYGYNGYVVYIIDLYTYVYIYICMCLFVSIYHDSSNLLRMRNAASDARIQEDLIFYPRTSRHDTGAPGTHEHYQSHLWTLSHPLTNEIRNHRIWGVRKSPLTYVTTVPCQTCCVRNILTHPRPLILKENPPRRNGMTLRSPHFWC